MTCNLGPIMKRRSKRKKQKITHSAVIEGKTFVANVCEFLFFVAVTFESFQMCLDNKTNTGGFVLKLSNTYTVHPLCHQNGVPLR